VGANLLQELSRRGHQTTVLLKPKTDRWRIERGLPASVDVVAGDLAQAGDAERAVALARPECIIHCAARGSYPAQSELVDIALSDVVGFARLLEAAASSGCAHIINSGSSSEYGTLSAGPSEESPVAPNSAYAASKAWSTWVGAACGRQLGVVVTTLRLYSAYGPLEDPSRLIPRVCAFGLRGEFPPFAEPGLVRDFVWIGDVVAAYVAVLEAGVPPGSEIYNIGSGRETRLDEVATIAGRVFGLAGEPHWEGYPARSWETPRWFADPRKAARTYGWVPAVDLEEGLGRMKRWLENDPVLRARYERAARS